MTSFEDLRSTTKKWGQCRLCTKPTGGTVMVVLREKGPGGQTSGKQLTSTSVSLCEEHCVALYEELANLANERVGRTS
jgi:hypothetical protein